MNGEEQEVIHPWYRGYKGDILLIEDKDRDRYSVCISLSSFCLCIKLNSFMVFGREQEKPLLKLQSCLSVTALLHSKPTWKN